MLQIYENTDVVVLCAVKSPKSTSSFLLCHGLYSNEQNVISMCFFFLLFFTLKHFVVYFILYCIAIGAAFDEIELGYLQ